VGTKIFAAALLGLLIASPAAAGVQTPAQALATDAAEYAQLFDVPLAEAMTRLRAQEASVAATDRIAATYGDRLAGIAIEHKPQYRVVVLLTGDVPVPDSEIRAGGMKVPVVFRTGAAATRDEVVASIEKNQAAIRAALPHPPALAADSRTGEMVVMVFGGDSDALGSEALRAQFAEMTGVPVRIEAIDRVAVDLAIEGGARVEGLVEGKRYYCTTGFVVTDGVGTGVVTAAHCPDALDYLDAANTRTPLTYAGQWGWGYRDVQLHTSEERLEPVFYADTAKSAARTVRTWRNRTSTRAGDVVCHRGETTGYSCAEVEYVDFAPAGDLCGGACLPRWVAVNGPQCKGGDSGAPVFLGTTAFGIVKGGNYLPDRSCRFYYYMSTDYLPDGWTLLHR
jgi:hypothetical protein